MSKNTEISPKERNYNKNAPLYEQIRPQSLEDVVGQQHLIRGLGIIAKMIEKKELFSIILWGPPGVGKTTIAKLLTLECDYNFINISAIFSSTQDVKQAIDLAKERQKYFDKTVLFVDEIHRFNTRQQDIFLPVLELGQIILIGATTENPSFHLNNALLSRCRVLELQALDEVDLELLLLRIEKHLGRKILLSSEIKEAIMALSRGDGRYFINLMESLLLLENYESLSLKKILDYLSAKMPQYDKKQEGHYSLISALHKSVRGSDEQAALYWFYRMVQGGEDLNYLARRLVRMAIEDIGLADPNALQLSIVAWQAYERLGDREGTLALAEVVVYLALSPKSNALYLAEKVARALADKTSNVLPPKHLMNATTPLMSELGYGKGYEYDHDSLHRFSGQHFFPEKMQRQEFYSPSELGFEKDLQKRMAYFNRLRKK